jgi:hypothetical protein
MQTLTTYGEVKRKRFLFNKRNEKNAVESQNNAGQ